MMMFDYDDDVWLWWCCLCLMMMFDYDDDVWRWRCLWLMMMFDYDDDVLTMMLFMFDDDVWLWWWCLTMMLFMIDDDVDYDLFMMVEYEVVMIRYYVIYDKMLCDLWYADMWFMIRCYTFTNDDVWWFVVIIFKMDCLWLCLWLIYNVWDGYD
jgi:hypothetical protein